MTIISLDIDGVLSEYPKYFLKFVKKSTGINFSTVQQIKSQLGITEYVELKNLYRKSDDKFNIPINFRFIEFSQYAYKNKLQIVILTSRPIFSFPDMYERTLNWLRNSDLKFEYLSSKNLLNIGNAECHVDDDIDAISIFKKSLAKKVDFIQFEFPQKLTLISISIFPKRSTRILIDFFSDSI